MLDLGEGERKGETRVLRGCEESAKSGKIKRTKDGAYGWR